MNEFIIWANQENMPFKIYSIKKDTNLDNLTITKQNPSGSFSVKKNSIINLEINLIENYEDDFLEKNLEKIKNLKMEIAENLFLKNGFLYKKIEIPSSEEEDKKILTASKKDEKNLRVYLGKKNKNFFLPKSLEKKNCKEIKNLFSEKNLEVKCLDSNNQEISYDHNLKIKNSNFSAGSFIKPGQIIYFWH